MTRKPDGWVVKDYHFVHATKEEALAWFGGSASSVKPVCLVPPDLLDWVEEVEKYFVLMERIERQGGFEGDADGILAILDKLREVRK